MTTMKALRAHRRGGPEQLVYEDATIPTPQTGEALVEVHAAAITFTELDWDMSWTARDGTDRTPVIPSHEFSGVVVAAGGSSDGPGIGDEVYGLIDFDRNGAAAQYALVRNGEIARRPTNVDHVEAATLPLSALTAYQALIEHADARSGERVLVHGGAGGVGVYAVQLADDLDAEVITTARSADAAFLSELGAAHVIDCTTQDFVDELSDIDVVVDTVGGATLERSFGVLRPGGRLVTLAAPPSQELAARHGVTASFFVVRPDRAQLAEIAMLVEAARLRPVVSQTFALADGRLAFDSSSRPRPPGKTVLVVRP